MAVGSLQGDQIEIQIPNLSDYRMAADRPGDCCCFHMGDEVRLVVVSDELGFGRNQRPGYQQEAGYSEAGSE